MKASICRCGMALMPMLAGVGGWAADEPGEGAKLYTLEECVRIGMERSARALNAKRDEDIAKAQMTQARSEAFPRLSVEARYTRMDEVPQVDFGGQTMELGSMDNYTAASTLSQILYGGGRVAAALRAAGHMREYARWIRADKDAELVRDIRRTFCDVLLAEEVVRVRQESLNQLESFAKQTQDRFDAKAASEFELLSAKVRLANGKPPMIEARNQAKLAREMFLRLLNMDDEDVAFVGGLQVTPMEGTCSSWEGAALRNRPGLRLMESLVGLKREDVVSTRAAGRPSLSAQATYSGANPYGMVPSSNEWEWHWTAGLLLTWSLWDGGLTRGQIREKQLEADKAATDLEEMRKMVRLEVRRAWLETEMAREVSEAGKGSVDMAEKALSIAGERQRAGLGTYLEYVDAHLGLSTARLARWQAAADYMKGVAQLEYATGKPWGGQGPPRGQQ